MKRAEKSEKRLGTTIALFTEAGTVIKSRLQRALPLPFAQCQTLSFVADTSRPSMREVARHFNITAPSATFLVEELARGGLLKRHASPGDRRKVELELTSKGQSALRAYNKKRDEVLGRMFNTLSESELRDLNRILKKIATTD